MRTIKFRGKDVTTGKWVYGYYVHLKKNKNHECHCIMTEHQYDNPTFTPEEGFNIDEEMFITINPINPETVGQFTNLRDKNGKEIYEGDILALEGESMKLEVRFVRGVFAFLWDGDLDEEFPCNAPTQEWAEVIGNIHDNPLTNHLHKSCNQK